MISATCATIALILASAPGGSVISLSGDCPSILIDRRYAPPITVKADRAVVRGLVIKGEGVVWQGGTVRAGRGEGGSSLGGYGIFIREARNVVIDGVTITDAKKAMVISKSHGVTVRSSRFVDVREDGIIASSSSGLTITRNEFRDFHGRPRQCALATTTVPRLRKSECTALGGTWTDGDHPDAVQLRNGIDGAMIAENRIDGAMQGIGQMDSPTDLPLKNIQIIGNRLRNTFPHSITLGACENCMIVDNDVSRVGGGKTVLRFNPEQTKACGNIVANGGKGRDSCRK